MNLVQRINLLGELGDYCSSETPGWISAQQRAHAENRWFTPEFTQLAIRQIAAEYQLNPITVSRAYQELADEDLVEKRRGLGMYMTDGAREKLLASERERFLKEEWPAMVERINRLGLDVEKLLRNVNAGGAA